MFGTVLPETEDMSAHLAATSVLSCTSASRNCISVARTPSGHNEFLNKILKLLSKSFT